MCMCLEQSIKLHETKSDRTAAETHEYISEDLNTSVSEIDRAGMKSIRT